MKPVNLKGAGFALRVPEQADAARITEICQDPEIQRWTIVPRPYVLEDAEAFIGFMVPQTWNNGGAAWVLEQETSPGNYELVGSLSIVSQGAGLGEIGYWATTSVRGTGLMEKACRLAIPFVFDRLRFPAISWRAEVGNWSSRKLAWRLGFEFGGQLRQLMRNDEGPVDTWLGILFHDSVMEPQTSWKGPAPNGQALPDARDPEALVRQFHEVYNLPIAQGLPSVDIDRIHMRMNLIIEEFIELVAAVYGQKAADLVASACETIRTVDDNTRDVVESADALADLIYVIYGMALETGISLESVLGQVQASNMSKLGADGKPIYREDGKVLKGPGFFEPDIAGALGLS